MSNKKAKQTKLKENKHTDVLFRFFDKANKGDMAFVDKLTDAELKEISPYLLLSWAQGATSNTMLHTMMTDIYMNDKVFSLSKHPRLLLKLFVAANCGIDDTRYTFVKPKGARKDKKVLAIAEYYQCTPREAEDYARILSAEDIEEIVSMTGEE